MSKAALTAETFFAEDITADVIFGPDGSLAECNKAFARAMGYDDEDAALASDIVRDPLPREGGKSMLELVRERQALRQFELEAVRADGSRVRLVGNVHGDFDDAGRLLQGRGYFFDISGRRKLEERLRAAQKLEAIGTLAGGVAHDFNNILGVIMGYAEIIMSSAEESGQTDLIRRTDAILTACRRGRDLVDQVLQFSQQEAGQRKPFRLGPIVSEVVELLSGAAPQGVSISEHVLTESDTLYADPAQLHQVVLNLTTNAVQAVRDTGGRVEISLVDVRLDESAQEVDPDLKPGNYLRLVVRDDGPGIPPEVISRIFDPFFTTKKSGEGSGMGLAVVHGVVKRHGGAILVQSEPGLGTTFQVFLPAAEPNPVERRTRPRQKLGEDRGRILFVDDEKDLVEIGKDLLGSMGFEVVGRTSSVEALAAFKHQPDKFEMVITDQNMPNLTGVELAREILDIRPEMPIVLCTGFSEVLALDAVKEMGISEFLMKPILRRNLVETVQRVMNRKGGE